MPERLQIRCSRCLSRTGTAPLRQPQCHILEHRDVQTLEADKQRVRVVNALYLGRELELRARIVVLSADTPQILLRSRNEIWPQGLANASLYVVDASFMPHSGAINPSLTIAANALRVTPHIAARLSNITAQ
jgi:choline dehydrogenase-like flavoprotein